MLCNSNTVSICDGEITQHCMILKSQKRIGITLSDSESIHTPVTGGRRVGGRKVNSRAMEKIDWRISRSLTEMRAGQICVGGFSFKCKQGIRRGRRREERRWIMLDECCKYVGKQVAM